ncbi:MULTISPECIES: Co2+/Mg2+ efflux protein ApaG [Hyphomicrobiales]|uniref:Protein ApaG n=1 Tax=Rhodopseudomonas julia TaxID=200617 RepID=A0ABU0C3L4_9BRAD|nr:MULTISPECIES: Co2+/Mg2+ efflux protein ApaG [Hyphomicrobiales]MCF1504790.1 Co2+/Mg2+ efflux protein ApaG [Afifella sp. H1R]MCT8269040.1 Co2+/Mg2+ efflux protein ApaG [Afifella sp. JA880]MDQ0325094.1 ApaG protein [Rhodopseudomonas julia]
MYRATTRNITVSVAPEFLEKESNREAGRFFWAYTIEITNEGQERVQLLRRHWQITDALGRTEEVHGPGVVGEQPEIPPGETFRYTSGCPLSTPSGIMVGSYDMVSETGSGFSVEIPAFSLDLPGQKALLH